LVVVLSYISKKDVRKETGSYAIISVVVDVVDAAAVATITT
jgi:hypothetical protein